MKIVLLSILALAFTASVYCQSLQCASTPGFLLCGNLCYNPAIQLCVDNNSRICSIGQADCSLSSSGSASGSASGSMGSSGSSSIGSSSTAQESTSSDLGSSTSSGSSCAAGNAGASASGSASSGSNAVAQESTSSNLGSSTSTGSCAGNTGSSASASSGSSSVAQESTSSDLGSSGSTGSSTDLGSSGSGSGSMSSSCGSTAAEGEEASCTLTNIRANLILSLWKQAFPSAMLAPLIGYPSASGGVMLLGHDLRTNLSTSPKILQTINGLPTKSPLVNCGIFSSECVNGKYINLYQINLPDIAGINGSMSTVELYVKSLKEVGLDVAGVNFHWMGQSMFSIDKGVKAIHHQSTSDITPFDFSNRTITALKNFIEYTLQFNIQELMSNNNQ